MPLNIRCLSLFLMILTIFNVSINSKEQCEKGLDAACDVEGEVDAHEKEKYNEEMNGKWNSYLELINEEMRKYKPCPHPDKECKCHESVIESDLAIWSDGISREVMDQAKRYGTHYQIINHVLYRSPECLFLARCSGVEHFILEIIDELPNMEFVLNSRDYPQSSKYHNPLPIFSFSKNKDYLDITYPAWTFWEGGPAITLYPTGIGRWDKHRISIQKAAKKWPWHNKTSVAFFRGSRTSAERDPLILLSRQKPDVADAQYTKNQAWKSDKDTLGMPPASEVSFENHCMFKYLFNFRGVAASFRFKHLFLCKSLVFHVGDDWKEFFYFPMKPWVHYIPVSPQLNKIQDLIDFVKENDDIAQEIAYRGYEFIWNHLKMEDVSCFWKKLLKKYATLLRYKVVKGNKLIKIS